MSRPNAQTEGVPAARAGTVPGGKDAALELNDDGDLDPIGDDPAIVGELVNPVVRPRFVTPHTYGLPEMLIDRVEHSVQGPTCGDCRHLGTVRSVTDWRGVKRLRRGCPRHRLGFTDVDWPACSSYEARGGSDGAG